MNTLLEGGHTETILCVASSADGRIVSGGEGGQMCLWSLDGNQPQKHKVSNVGEDVTSICCSKLKPQELFIACGQKVCAYDVRHMEEPMYVFEQNEDEVNQIALHEKEEHLAASDDSGQIKVFNLVEKKVYKTLRKHTNICSTVAFRPHRTYELLSGGLDNMLLHWDYSRNRSICSIDMKDLGIEGEEPESYLVNPPFVHSVAISNNGNFTACGTESGLVQVFDSSKKIMTFLKSLSGHGSGVSQVHFPSFDENMLISGGNDGQIMIWDTTDCVNAAVVANGHVNHVNGQASQSHTNRRRNRNRRNNRGNRNANANGNEAEHANGHANGNGHANANGHANGNGHANVNGHANGEENGAANVVERPAVHPKHIIEHNDKINWISSVARNDSKILVVADNSVDNNLTLYDIPE